MAVIGRCGLRLCATQLLTYLTCYRALARAGYLVIAAYYYLRQCSQHLNPCTSEGCITYFLFRRLGRYFDIVPDRYSSLVDNVYPTG